MRIMVDERKINKVHPIEKNNCEYKNKYGRCEIDDYNCFYKDQEKIEQCKERKENDNKFDKE